MVIEEDLKKRAGRIRKLLLSSSLKEALEQINSKNYALSYETEGRNVVKVGVQFDRETMTVGEWKIES